MFLKSVYRARKYYCLRMLNVESYFKNQNYFKNCFGSYFHLHNVCVIFWKIIQQKKTKQSSVIFCTLRNHEIMKCTRTSCCFGVSLNMHTVSKKKEYLFTDMYGKSQHKHYSGLVAAIVLNNRWRSQFYKANRMVLI